MLWLMLAKGLLIGAWHTKIGQDNICNLHNSGVFETLEHGFMGCIVVEEAWSNFKEIRARCSLNSGLDSWEGAMLGEIPQPHNRRRI